MGDRTAGGDRALAAPGLTVADLTSLVQDLLGTPVGPLRPLGAGTDHRTFEAGDRLVVRVPLSPSEEGVHAAAREADLLEVLSALLPVAVPVVLASDPDTGVTVTARVDGVPLLDTAVDGSRLVDDLVEVLVALHDATPDVAASGLAADPFALEAYVHEASETLAAWSHALPPRQIAALEALLGDPLPAESSLEVLCHNDLGAEHLFVDTGVQRLVGIIDWADAALVDPARDLGRLYRDLGPDATRSIVARLPYRDDAQLSERVRLHAVCSALEDLAYGMEHDERYARAAMAGLERTLAQPGP